MSDSKASALTPPTERKGSFSRTPTKSVRLMASPAWRFRAIATLSVVDRLPRFTTLLAVPFIRLFQPAGAPSDAAWK
ncbi:hypothetical protein D3C72_1320180 [compost metagenome]